MKTLLFAAALAMGSASVAHAQTSMQAQSRTSAQADHNGPNTPPGDGITRLGTNPEGQPYTPAGFNRGMNVYPAAWTAPGMVPGMAAYPRCSRQVTDRCIQGYAMRGAEARRVSSR